MRWLPVIFLASALLACSERPQSDVAHKERRAQREEAARQHSQQPPRVAKHDVDGSELVVLDVPVVDGFSKEWQKCFVWRDAWTKSATLSCPSREVYIGRSD